MLAAAGAAALFGFGSAGGAVLVVAAASLFNALSVVGWNTLGCLSTESFPTSLRATGMGAVSACGRLGSIAAQFANGYLEGQGVAVLLLATAGVMAAGGAVVLALPRDTLATSLDDEGADECEEAGEAKQQQGEVSVFVVDDASEEELAGEEASAVRLHGGHRQAHGECDGEETEEEERGLVER